MLKEDSSSLDNLVLRAGCHFCLFTSFGMTDMLPLSKQRLLINQSNAFLLRMNEIHSYWHLLGRKASGNKTHFFFQKESLLRCTKDKLSIHIMLEVETWTALLISALKYVNNINNSFVMHEHLGLETKDL